MLWRNQLVLPHTLERFLRTQFQEFRDRRAMGFLPTPIVAVASRLKGRKS